MITGVWEEFLDIVRQEAGSRVVETWFRAVQLQNWDAQAKTAYLQAPNVFVRNWLASNYTKLIQTHLARLLHIDELKVQILVSGAKEEAGQKEGRVALVPTRPLTRVEQETGNTLPGLAPNRNNGYLNKQYVFENFVVGSSNSLAYAAAQAVAEKPGSVYNPLFIYGQSGLGKTHLMHAIGNGIKKTNPKAAVLYQTADRFVNEFINAIRFDKIHRFKAKYQNIDVLLIDDVQFISNKDQTQEAFFHIFNTLYESHKQIIFSSDVVPQSMQGIPERLRSRMAWGLVVDIHAPKLETKIAILKRKAHASNEMITDDVAHFIAETVDSNIRELEGALIRVIAFSALTKQPINLVLAQKVLQRTQTVQQQAIDFHAIVTIIKRHFPYNLQHLQSKNRNKDIAHIRQITMFLMKKYTDRSLRDIGTFLGGRDHSTVMHAFNKIEQAIKQDEIFAQQIRTIERELVQ
ncbi:MAG: chromosomal replication initiator protein DnaA [Candidatus Dependentiae bacterium]